VVEQRERLMARGRCGGACHRANGSAEGNDQP
jgi:hypothetical protein